MKLLSQWDSIQGRIRLQSADCGGLWGVMFRPREGVFFANTCEPCWPDRASPWPLQIILAILVSWLLCFIFTVTDVFPPDSTKYGFYARTDARQGVLLVAPWFKVPYPCKYSDGQRGQEPRRAQPRGVGSWQNSLLCPRMCPEGLAILVRRGLDSK